MRKGKATEGLVQHCISISGVEVVLCNAFLVVLKLYFVVSFSVAPPTEIQNR